MKHQIKSLAALVAFMALSLGAWGQSDESIYLTVEYRGVPTGSAYVYSKGGVVICTKTETESKYGGDGYVQYHRGAVDFGGYEKIPKSTDKPIKLTVNQAKKHICLQKFGLI
jgi:hypothetical protein